MDVTFQCEGRVLTLPEAAARVIEERLRQYADGRIPIFPDPALMTVSLAVADAIDQEAVGVRAEPIPLEGQISEVVYQAARMCRFEAIDHLAAAALLEALYAQRALRQ